MDPATAVKASSAFIIRAHGGGCCSYGSLSRSGLSHPAAERVQKARAVLGAIEVLRTLPEPQPLITDDIGHWLSTRAVRTLHAQGIESLADLTVRVPQRR